MEQLNFQNEIETVLRQARKERGHVNILIAGRTGVGKSTLINSVFQGDFAETGQGKPVTTGTTKITKENIPLSIYDTRGLEMKDYKETVQELKDLIKKLSTNDPNDHIHAAWVCIAEPSARIEVAEQDLVKMLSKEGIPVIVVITKATSYNKDFKRKVEDILQEARKVICVNSIETRIENNDEEIVIKPKGLDKLVEVTSQVVPDGQKSAFIASQKVDIEKKKSESLRIVGRAAALAAGIGAVPIPFSDAVSIVPIQIGMIAKISAIFGLPINIAFMHTMLASTITGSVGTITGKAIVSNFLKILPGVNISAGVVHAAVASGITTTFGQAYITVLATLFIKNNGVPPTGEEVLKAFKEQYEKSKSESKHEEHDQESESKHEEHDQESESKHEEHDQESESEQDK
ncbi:MAG: DUF697 domain-containing protein [Richelia sp. RM1_1_1]|nr:DUF697 domain-containing protein [Richelia sp. RM1_1_1]